MNDSNFCRRLAVVLLCLSSAHSAVAETMRSYDLRHSSPAKAWTEASPLGNGRIGAMVNGGTREERIQLNEDTLWSGEPLPHLDGKPCLENLPKVRELIYAGKHEEATALGQRTMLGTYNQCYQPLGDLRLSMPEIVPGKVTGYDRVLDLNHGLSITKFTHDGIHYQRTVFISEPDQLLVVRLTSTGGKGMKVQISLDSLLEHEVRAEPGGDRLLMTGRAPLHADPHYQGRRLEYDSSTARKGMRYGVVLQIDAPHGKCVAMDGKLIVEGADDITVKLSAATSYNGFQRSPSAEGRDAVMLALVPLEKAKARSVKMLQDRHVKDHASLFERVDLQLGDTERQNAPVSGRTGAKHTPGQDPDLDELFYQFGRYLLIASSREGSQPANLQGIWSYKLNPSWSANWTLNCNAQFNYIGAGAAGLSNLGEPFKRMAFEASVDGAKVAKSWYGAQGWVFHHNLDLWRAAIPVAGNVMWATFPTGGTWTTVELYDLWKFDNDKKSLKELWPLMRGNVEFWLDHLTKDPVSGQLVSCPDVYFENSAQTPEGKGVLLCSAPVSSTIIIKQSFLDLIEAAGVLGIRNDPVIDRAKIALEKFPQIEVNRHGEIRQWDRDKNDDWKESDPTQLLVMNGAIYSSQIHPRLTPKLAAALGLMLDRRKLGLDGQASWRAAFPANTYARLGLGNKCHQVISAFYKTWANPNLTARFIQADWEIDGNLGMMGAIQECLVQSHGGEIELLPALPDAWKKQGFVRGMGARGGYTVSFAWKDEKVTEWTLEGTSRESVKMRINGKLLEATPSAMTRIVR